MPLPENLATVTVTATYEEADGSLASGGSVTFDPARLLMASQGKVIFGRPATAVIVNGQIAVTLPATDNTDLNPTGFTYTVTENVAGWPARVYQIELPASLSPTVDLSELSPAADPPPPTEQAGGDLSGPYANPVVIRTHLGDPLPVAQGGTGLDASGDAGTVLTSDGDGTVSWQPAPGPGAWQQPVLADGVTSMTGAPELSYRMTADSEVQIRGVVALASGWANPVFTLPDGFIPPGTADAADGFPVAPDNPGGAALTAVPCLQVAGQSSDTPGAVTLAGIPDGATTVVVGGRIALNVPVA